MNVHLSERLYQQIVEQVPDGMVFADQAGVIRLWNSSAETIFGYSADEAIGQTLDMVVPERFREAHWAGFRQAMATGKTKYGGQVLPTRSMTKGGNTIYIDLALAVVRDDQGQVLGALATVRDITERRNQERALRERLAELESKVKGDPKDG